jgi:1,4-dihydroxy-2-naphthoate octaprenyltransferase
MTTISSKQGMLFLFNFLLLLPATAVIVASLLKYELGIDAVFDAIAPTMEKWGIKDPPGLNITSLVVFGPLAVLLIAVVKTIKLRLAHEQEMDKIIVEIKPGKMLRSFMIVSILVLGILATYFFFENIGHLIKE